MLGASLIRVAAIAAAATSAAGRLERRARAKRRARGGGTASRSAYSPAAAAARARTHAPARRLRRRRERRLGRAGAIARRRQRSAGAAHAAMALGHRHRSAALFRRPGASAERVAGLARAHRHAHARRAGDLRLAPSASERVDFLRQDDGPATGDGRIALASRSKDLGRRSEANEIARAAWREDALTAAAEARALERIQLLTSEDHAARVGALLWRDQRSAAQRLFPRLSPPTACWRKRASACRRASAAGCRAGRFGARLAPRRPGLCSMTARNIAAAPAGPKKPCRSPPRSMRAQAPLIARDDIFRERRLYVPRAHARWAISACLQSGVQSWAHLGRILRRRRMAFGLAAIAFPRPTRSAPPSISRI